MVSWWLFDIIISSVDGITIAILQRCKLSRKFLASIPNVEDHRFRIR